MARHDPGIAHDEAAELALAQEAALKKKAQKVKLIQVEDTSKDVYIPSAISVSNLARLLNIRIGAWDSYVLYFIVIYSVLIYGCRSIARQNVCRWYG